MNMQFILYFEQVLLQLFLIIMGTSYCAADLTILKFHPKYFMADVIDIYIYVCVCMYIYIYIYVMKSYCTSPLHSNQP